MQLDDLRRLKLALDTGTTEYFHGDIGTALKEVVDELVETRTLLLEEIEDQWFDSIPELVDAYKRVSEAVCKLDDLKDEIGEKTTDLKNMVQSLERLLN